MHALAADVKRVGRDLGVRYVLTGSVRRNETRLRISAQLIDAASGTHVWAERYDRTIGDIFALQDETALAVVGAIEPSLRRAEVERIRRTRPNSLDAYELVLRAQSDVDSGMPDRAANALPLLQQALAIEPAYALAHGLAAMCHHNRFLRAGLREEDRTASVRHARLALEYGRDDALALTFAGFCLGMDAHDRTAAFAAFETALALSPPPRSLTFSEVLSIAGRPRRSRRSNGANARCGSVRLTPGPSRHSARRRSGISCKTAPKKLRRRLTSRCSRTPPTASIMLS